MALKIQKGEAEFSLAPTNPSSPLPSPGPSTTASSTAPALILTNSGKKMDQSGSRKKYVKQVTGRHNDTELHLAAQRGDLAAVRLIMTEIDAQMTGSAGGEEFDAEVAEIRSAVVNEVNEVEETSLMIAAEGGFLDVVVELLKYSDRESVLRKNKSGFDALHSAAKGGHREIVQVLLAHDPMILAKSLGPSNITPLISAATRGHTEVVKLLLDQDTSQIELSKSNGKNALHFAARQGHVEIVKALLEKDQQLARRTDKKGQTALQMAVKGSNCEVVKALVDADPAIVMLPDRAGNTALHVATRKKRSEIVNVLLSLPDIHVNALTRDHKTAFDIAEGLPLSEESTEIKECLSRYGAVRANELNQPRDELRKTVIDIKKDVHTQLEQTRKTNKNVHGIAKELRKLHREGINNATNSVTVVAVLFATVAFAAIFTVPGGNNNDGTAVALDAVSFKIFFIFNAIALFTSLAVVVVQITLVRGAESVPGLVKALSNVKIVQAAIGGWHCLAVDDQGQAYAWGGNEYGQCGEEPERKEDGTKALRRDIAIPQRCAPKLSVRQVAAGGTHSVVLTQDGYVWTWGQPWPPGDIKQISTPVRVQGLEQIRLIAVGAFHNLALSEDGMLLAWGNNEYGQLGTGDTQPRSQPIPVQGLAGLTLVDIAAGGWHSTALTSDGEVYGWGRGEHGRLGFGDNDKSSKMVPQKVQLLVGEDIVQVSCGGTHSVACTLDGRMFSFGRGDHGRLGYGRKVTTGHPMEVPINLPPPKHRGSSASGLWCAKFVACGGRHTLAIASWVDRESEQSGE